MKIGFVAERILRELESSNKLSFWVKNEFQGISDQKD